MKIQVNTDKNIQGREGLVAHVQATVAKSLGHLSAHVTRVEVHLSDEDGPKSGQKDKRCVIEARIEGRQPTAVTCHAGTLSQAVDGAVDRLKSALQSTLDQQHGHR